MKNLIFITFDGIQNSVFAGQVIEPLLKKIKNDSDLKVFIVSFEKDKLTADIIKKNIPQNIYFKYYRRPPILGKISLYPSIFFLKSFLKQFDNYEIIARGPIAGWVAKKAINKNCSNLITQARGLLEQEYKFTHLPQKNIFKRSWHIWRAKTLFDIENEIYSSNILIKSVSNALTEHLIKTYNSNASKIILELDDIPENISQYQKKEWRKIIRQELKIDENQTVYCYSGAVKAWQCPDLIIEFFQKQLLNKDNSFLLVLTQDKEKFERMMKENKIPKANYLILTVEHEAIYKYLCACDYGLIFRKLNHIVNWVSRPVKAMEYKSANLKIIHNKTVKWLIDNC